MSFLRDGGNDPLYLEDSFVNLAGVCMENGTCYKAKFYKAIRRVKQGKALKPQIIRPNIINWKETKMKRETL